MAGEPIIINDDTRPLRLAEKTIKEKVSARANDAPTLPFLLPRRSMMLAFLFLLVMEGGYSPLTSYTTLLCSNHL